ncbi:MAG: hypothetical protein M3179_08400 [Actinomycetota bacterium]|nr:hypothetical protein [Actinomycetota bacterium]
MTTGRRWADSPRFWLLIAAVLVADAALTVAVVDGWAVPFAVSILGFALASLATP